MKAVVILLIALLGSLASAYTTVCPSYKCVGNNQACSITVSQEGVTSYVGCNNYKTLGCSIGTTSPVGNYSGTCTTLPTAGQACLSANTIPSSGVCAWGLECNSTTKNCQTPSITRYPGEACTASSTCTFSNITSGADINQCVGGTCLFVADGGACSGDNQCKSVISGGSYCNIATGSTTGTCAPLLADGTACKTNDDNCLNQCLPSAVTGTDGKCGGAYSLAAGAPCVSFFGLGIQCGGNLYCSNPATGNNYGVCTAAAASTTLHKPCTNSSNCNQDTEVCSCNPSIGKGPICLSTLTAKNAKSTYDSGLNCVRKSGCLQDDNSCINNKCKSQTCAYSNLGERHAGGCSSFCGAASSVVVSYFLLALVAAFLMF